jgi:hypothetical protein
MRIPSHCLSGTIVIALLALAAPARANAPDGRYTVTGGTVYDGKTKLTWQQAAPPDMLTWAGAKSYCAGLGTTLGGTGWRLPTVKELMTIVDFSRMGPAIDPIAFPSAGSGDFWSASLVTYSSGTRAYFIGFAYGISGNKEQSQQGNVRCVR